MLTDGELAAFLRLCMLTHCQLSNHNRHVAYMDTNVNLGPSELPETCQIVRESGHMVRPHDLCFRL